MYRNVQTYRENMDAVLGEINNKRTGIFNTLNCKFVLDNVNYIYSDLCEDMFPNLAKLSIIMLLFGFLSIGSSCCSLAISRRLQGKIKPKKSPKKGSYKMK